jgi:hypothetical protein
MNFAAARTRLIIPAKFMITREEGLRQPGCALSGKMGDTPVTKDSAVPPQFSAR